MTQNHHASRTLPPVCGAGAASALESLLGMFRGPRGLLAGDRCDVPSDSSLGRRHGTWRLDVQTSWVVLPVRRIFEQKKTSNNGSFETPSGASLGLGSPQIQTKPGFAYKKALLSKESMTERSVRRIFRFLKPQKYVSQTIPASRFQTSSRKTVISIGSSSWAARFHLTWAGSAGIKDNSEFMLSS